MSTNSEKIEQILEDYALFQRSYNDIGNEGWKNRTKEATQAITQLLDKAYNSGYDDCLKENAFDVQAKLNKEVK